MSVRMRSRLAPSLLLAAAALSACGPSPAASSSAADDELNVVASFYPLQWVTQQVVGRATTVHSLTKPGAEPHDIELSPREVATIAEADLVIYLQGFQPAVDEAVREEATERAFDTTEAADLNLTYTAIEEGEEHADEAGATDPHFWLDPLRLAAVADAIAARLAKLDPENAAQFRANAKVLNTKLHALHREFTSGLAECASRDLVTSHNAFGYLAQRYDLRQVGITGLTPENEPTPAELDAVADFVQKRGVRTIYYETLVSPAVARTVAAETGARTEVLDPIEGLTPESEGKDYLQVMRNNLANIKKGQPCR